MGKRRPHVFNRCARSGVAVADDVKHFHSACILRVEFYSYVPLDRLLVETDSPYLAPVPHRGKENQPAMVRDVAEYMAVLKGVAVEELAQVTTDNFARLFHIDASRLQSIR